MLVRPKHLEWNFKKREDLQKSLAAAITKGELTEQQASEILEASDFTPFIEKPAEYCFFCGKKLTIPAVMWHGFPGTGSGGLEIWLHPGCVDGLVQRLLRDANEAEHGKEIADGGLKLWKAKHPQK